MQEPTADQLDLQDPGNGPGDGVQAPVEAQPTPESPFDATDAAGVVFPEAASVPPDVAADAAAPMPVDAASEPTPAPAPAPEAQASLLDYAEAAVAVAAVPPAAAAKTSDLTGATNVATYGDRDLDEMVAELAAAATAMQAEGKEATPGDPGVASSPDLEAVDVAVVAAESAMAPTWPFLIYAGVWAVYAVGLALVMKSAAFGGSLFASPYYQVFLWGGLALAVVGPCLVLVVWLVARRSHEKGHRGGLFSSALLKGAMALFVGVLLWWAAYYAAVWLAATGR